MSELLFHATIDGHLGCFQFVFIMNTHIKTHVYIYIFQCTSAHISVCEILENRTSGLQAGTMFILVDNMKVFKLAVSIYTVTSSVFSVVLHL